MERKIFNINFAVIFLSLGIYFVKSSTFTYETRLNVIAVPNSQQSSRNTRGASAIAQFIGIPNQSISMSNFDLYKKMFKSRLLSEVLFYDLDFMKKVFPGQRDEKNNTWITPEAKGFLKLKLIVKSFLGLPNSSLKPLSVSTLEHFLLTNIRVDTSDEGITTISIDTVDPEKGEIYFK